MDGQGRVLLTQRPAGKAMAGLWEFPGGKAAAGETPEAALVRELAEELGIAVAVADLWPLTFASHGSEDFHLLMPLYLCRAWRGDPHSREGQDFAWVEADALADYAMPAADTPLIAPLRAALGRA